MDDRVLSSLICQLMQGNKEVSFCWQGGEPMLAGLDFFERVVEYQMKYGTTGQAVSNSIQTNGVLIDRKWAKFFKEFKVLVGLSLDGPEEIHDKYRRYPSGKRSFRKVVEAIRILKEYEVDFNILTVLTRANVKKADELYDFFTRQYHFSFLQFIPCINADANITPFTISSEEYESFLKKMFDLWFNNGNPKVSMRLFDSILMAYLGLPTNNCQLGEECGAYLVVEYNGDIYPCDFLVERSFYLGNLLKNSLSEITESEKFGKFKKMKSGSFPECKGCKYKFICHQGCPAVRMFAEKSGQNGNYYFPAIKNFLFYSEERFKIVAQNLSARLPVKAEVNKGVQ
jgi:uncharacterized protein